VTLKKEKKAQRRETITHPVKNFLLNLYAVPYILSRTLVYDKQEEGRDNVRQRPDDEQSQEQKDSDAASNIGSLLQTFRVICWIFISDIFLVSCIVGQANRAESFPSVIGVLEDRDADCNNGSSSDTCDTAVETRISGANRGDGYFAGEALGKG
jgi:hypothetical protein